MTKSQKIIRDALVRSFKNVTLPQIRAAGFDPSPMIGQIEAELRWRRTLTHELTHAVMAGFKGDAPLPYWLEEGLAEMLAERVWPRPNAIGRAKARGEAGLGLLLDPDYRLVASDYPVAMSLVMGLHREDPARFGQFIQRLKRGEDQEQLLHELYGVDFAGLDRAWRNWITRQ